MKDTDKAELARLARLANNDDRGDFWDEVENLLDKDDEEPEVKPRRERE